MRKKKRQGLAGGFVAIPNLMIACDAYKKLTGSALKALILCLLKAKIRNEHQRYLTHFELTYAEARRCGIPNTSFVRAMVQLVELGFIVVVRCGGKVNDGEKWPTIYRLSENYKDYGTMRFKSTWKGYAENVHGQ